MYEERGARSENRPDQQQETAGCRGEIWQAGEAELRRKRAGQLTALAGASSGADIREYAMELESLLMAEEAETSAICERIEYLILQCKNAASTQ